VLKGFYQPVDMNGVYNIVKNGSTVPLKFEIVTKLSGVEIIDITLSPHSPMPLILATRLLPLMKSRQCQPVVPSYVTMQLVANSSTIGRHPILQRSAIA
jgi:predicted secreted protein